MNKANNTRINHIYSSLISADIILMYDKAFNIGPGEKPTGQGMKDEPVKLTRPEVLQIRQALKEIIY